MTRAELVKKSEENRAREKREVPLAIICLVLPVALAWLLNCHESSKRFAVIALIAGAVGFYAVLIVSFFNSRKRRRRLGCFCPQCRKDLIGFTLLLAVASGRCGRCGAVILEDWNK